MPNFCGLMKCIYVITHQNSITKSLGEMDRAIIAKIVTIQTLDWLAITPDNWVNSELVCGCHESANLKTHIEGWYCEK